MRTQPESPSYNSISPSDTNKEIVGITKVYKVSYIPFFPFFFFSQFRISAKTERDGEKEKNLRRKIWMLPPPPLLPSFIDRHPE